MTKITDIIKDIRNLIYDESECRPKPQLRMGFSSWFVQALYRGSYSFSGDDREQDYEAKLYLRNNQVGLQVGPPNSPESYFSIEPIGSGGIKVSLENAHYQFRLPERLKKFAEYYKTDSIEEVLITYREFIRVIFEDDRDKSITPFTHAGRVSGESDAVLSETIDRIESMLVLICRRKLDAPERKSDQENMVTHTEIMTLFNEDVDVTISRSFYGAGSVVESIDFEWKNDTISSLRLWYSSSLLARLLNHDKLRIDVGTLTFSREQIEESPDVFIGICRPHSVKETLDGYIRLLEKVMVHYEIENYGATEMVNETSGCGLPDTAFDYNENAKGCDGNEKA